MMIDQNELGNRLRQLRQRRGVSQKQLAKELKVTQSVMSRLENGEEIHSSALLSVLQYFGISLDYLFSSDFDIDDNKLYLTHEEARRLFRCSIHTIKDIIKTSFETSLHQLESIEQKIL